jgi:hypothetical protein
MTLDLTRYLTRYRNHTPGPWKVHLVDDTTVIAADGSEIASVDGDYNEPNAWPVMEANARLIADAPALLAEVIALREEVEDLKDAVKSLVEQFAPSTTRDGVPHLWTGGMSALEQAFSNLGWADPHPIPEDACDEPGCGRRASEGFPTKGGYRRTCSLHYERRIAEG